MEGNQCRLPGVRQDDGLIIVPVPQLLADPSPRGPVKSAMAKGTVDDAGDLGHAREQGRYPGRRERVDFKIGVLPRQPLKQRLRHDRVTDPRRRNNQNAVAHLESVPWRKIKIATEKGALAKGRPEPKPAS